MEPRTIHKDLTLLLWNARSIIPKRSELEVLLWTHDPHLVCITETWLTQGKVFEIPNFITVRQDRLDGLGGGVLILIRKEIAFRITNSTSCQFRDLTIDMVSIDVHTLYGKTQISCLYAPPGRNIPTEIWGELFEALPENVNHIFCGDVNAHHTSWGDMSSNCRGSSLLTFALNKDLYIANDSTPTRFCDANVSGNNLDLSICSAAVLQSSTVEVIEDHVVSDHFPVLLKANILPEKVAPSSFRLNLKELNWLDYGNAMEKDSLELVERMSMNVSLLNIYDSFVECIKSRLMENGAYLPQNSSIKPFSKPLW